MDELCNHYPYAGLTCIIIFIYRIRVYWRKQLDGLGQRPWPTFLIAPELHMPYIQAGEGTQNIIKVRHLVFC